MANSGREFFKQARAVQALPLRCGPKALLLNLLIFADSRGEAWPSHGTLAAAVGSNRRAVQLWQKELQERGLLIVESGGGRSNRYRLNLQSLENSAPDAQVEQENSAPDAQAETENCARHSRNSEPDAHPCAPRSHNPPMNSLEHPKESARTQFRKPSMEELEAFASESKLSSFDAAAFFDHFESNGWRIGGRTAMKDWRAAVRNWVRRESQFRSGPRSSAGGGPAGSAEALEAWDRLREGLRKFGAVQPAKIRAGFDETDWPRVWGAVKAAGGWDAIGNRPEHSRGAFLAAFDASKGKEHQYAR